MMFTLKEPRPFRLGGALLKKRFQLEDKNILAATSGVIQRIGRLSDGSALPWGRGDRRTRAVFSSFEVSKKRDERLC